MCLQIPNQSWFGVDQQCQETEEDPNEEEFKAHNNKRHLLLQ